MDHTVISFTKIKNQESILGNVSALRGAASPGNTNIQSLPGLGILHPLVQPIHAGAASGTKFCFCHGMPICEP